jgi:hypothetical protein
MVKAGRKSMCEGDVKKLEVGCGTLMSFQKKKNLPVLFVELEKKSVRAGYALH